jgi:hypothetical protein
VAVLDPGDVVFFGGRVLHRSNVMPTASSHSDRAIAFPQLFSRFGLPMERPREH